MPENKQIENSEVQNIIGNPPRGIIRKGNAYIFIFFVILAVLAAIVQYPEIIPSQVTITSDNPPITLVARQAGKLMLRIEDNQQVKSGEVLAVIESASDYAMVDSLTNLILGMNLRKFILDSAKIFVPLPDFEALGSIQTEYGIFRKRYDDYRFFTTLEYHDQQIGAIEPQLDKYKQLKYTNQKLKNVLQKDYKLSKEKYDIDKGLYEKKVLSKSDLDKTESAMLQKQYNLEQINSSILSADIKVSELEKNIVELNLQYEESKKQLESDLLTSYNSLLNTISIWEENYSLRTPIDGQVSLFSFWKDNQFVSAGDEVMTIVPFQKKEFIGKVILPMRSSGKVKIGQTVNIKLDNYPFEEYGMLEGRIESISLIPQNGNYLLNVSLPEGLKTSYRIDLSFRQQMTGTADIITEDLTLLQRILYQFRKLGK